MPSQRPESGDIGVNDLESTARLPVLDVAAIDLDVDDESHLGTTVLPPDAFTSSDTHRGIPILKEPIGLASDDARVVVRQAAAAGAAARVGHGDPQAAAEAEAAVGQLLERQAELLREMQEVREEAEARYLRLEADLDAARRLGEDLDAMRREADARTLAAEQRSAALEAEFAAARDELEAEARAAASLLRQSAERESAALRQRLEADLIAARRQLEADAEAARLQRDLDLAQLRQQHEAALTGAQVAHRAEVASLGDRQAAEAAAQRVEAEAARVALRRQLDDEHEATRRRLGAELAALREQLSNEAAAHEVALRTARGEAAELGRQLTDLRGLKAQDEAALAGSRDEVAALGRALEDARAELAAAQRSAQQSLDERGRELELAHAGIAELRALAAVQVEALQAAESRRGIWASLLGDAESTHDEQLREAREAAEAERGRAAAAQAESDARERERAARDAEVRAERDAAATRADEIERRAEHLRTALAQAQGALVAARADADGQADRLAEFETRLDALQSRERAAVAAAEAASAGSAELERRLQALQQELDVAGSAARAGLEALRADLDASRAERDALQAQRGTLQVECDALQAERDALRVRNATLAESAERAAALETRVPEADPSEALRTLHGELRQGADRVAELESDLRAAEDQVHRLEGELRVKTSRLEELGRTGWPAVASSPEVPSIGGRRRDEFAPRGRGQADVGATGEPALPSDSGFSGAGAAASADGVTRYFVLMDGDTEIVHVLGRRTTIGRGLDNDVRIDTKFISRHHAVVLAGPSQTVVEDLRSTNGVLVNGRRVTRSVLRDGDIVHVGKTQFRFVQRHRER